MRRLLLALVSMIMFLVLTSTVFASSDICSINVYNLRYEDGIIKATIKNNGDVDTDVDYVVYVDGNEVESGTIDDFDNGETYRVYKDYDFDLNEGQHEIQVKAESECGSSDIETLYYYEHYYSSCRSPLGYQGQTRCERDTRRYLMCDRGDWVVIGHNDDDYFYYCRTCGDGYCNGYEDYSNCPTDCASCEPGYLDQQRYIGGRLYRLYQNNYCVKEWVMVDGCWPDCGYPYYTSPQRICDIEITKFDYVDLLPGIFGWVTVEVENKGDHSDRIELTLFIDDESSKNVFFTLKPGESKIETIYYETAKDKAEKLILVKAESDCGVFDSREAAITFQGMTPPYQPEIPEEPEEAKELPPTKVTFHPTEIHVYRYKGRTIGIDVETFTPQEFNLQITGVPDSWVEHNPVEFVNYKRTIYAHLAPQELGQYYIHIELTAMTEDIVFTKDIPLFVAAGETTEELTEKSTETFSGIVSLLSHEFALLTIAILLAIGFGVVIYLADKKMQPEIY